MILVCFSYCQFSFKLGQIHQCSSSTSMLFNNFWFFLMFFNGNNKIILSRYRLDNARKKSVIRLTFLVTFYPHSFIISLRYHANDLSIQIWHADKRVWHNGGGFHRIHSITRKWRRCCCTKWYICSNNQSICCLLWFGIQPL